MEFKDLTSEQKIVVQAPIGNIRVTAVAGAGKTATLAFRVQELLNRGVSPDEILLITFSNKAAIEMSKRVSYLIPDSNFSADTFHSFGNKLCKRFSSELGLPKDFKILKPDLKKTVMEEARKKILSESKVNSVPKYNVLLEMYSGAINHNMKFEDYITKFYNIKKPVVIETIKNIFKEYIFSKQNQGFVDFDDLLLNTYDLLNNARIKRIINKEYKHILVDEFQDINYIQSIIIKKLNGNDSLFIIGDSSQSIYEWRGSDSSYIQNFDKEFKNVQSYQLTTNFRSTQEILNYCEDSINNNPDSGEIKLRSNNSYGDLPAIFSADNPKEAYEIIATDISKNYLKELDNVAILVRYNAECSDVKRIFDKIGIPTVIDKTKSLTSTKHFKDIRNFLIFLEDPNPETCTNILPLFGIGKSKHQQLINDLKKVNFDFSKLNSSDQKINAAAALLSGVFFKKGITISEKIDKFFELVYKDLILKSRTNHEQIFEDIDFIIKQSIAFKTFNDFENYYAINEDLESTSAAAVKVLTVHKAKGLEFKYVYIIGLNEGYFPKNLDDPKEVENERKLFYVGCTRAKEALIICFYEHDINGQPLVPSIFIEEVSQQLYNF